MNAAIYECLGSDRAEHDAAKDALVAWVQSAWNWKFVLIQSCQAEITTACLYAAMVTPQDRNRNLTKPD
jgi:hypothetical protein